MTSERVSPGLSALEPSYEVIREIGHGGTSVVYLARERASNAEVAIKLIRSKYLGDEEAMGRFAREARFLERLVHPNIVRVRDVLELGDAGLALVMAHVAGRTLKELIREDGRLEPNRVERFTRDIARALGAAHAMGIVHRDVKPENVFVDPEDRPLLADFGLARSMTGDSQLTMAGVAIGTPAYMPPEQIEGASLDARGDIYSLGLVAWEMLTGHRPWEGESLYAILYRQRYEQLPDVRDLRDDVPDSLGDAIAVAIEKNPAMRWQSAAEMIEALDGAIIPRRTTRRPPLSADTVRFTRPVGGVPRSDPPVAAEPPAARAAHAAPRDRAGTTAGGGLAGARRAAAPERSIRRDGSRVDAALARRARVVVHRLGHVLVARRGARCARRRAGLGDGPQVRPGARRRRGRRHARRCRGKPAGSVERRAPHAGSRFGRLRRERLRREDAAQLRGRSRRPRPRRRRQRRRLGRSVRRRASRLQRACRRTCPNHESRRRRRASR